jgi:hypothetical protein
MLSPVSSQSLPEDYCPPGRPELRSGHIGATDPERERTIAQRSRIFSWTASPVNSNPSGRIPRKPQNASWPPISPAPKSFISVTARDISTTPLSPRPSLRLSSPPDNWVPTRQTLTKAPPTSPITRYRSTWDRRAARTSLPVPVRSSWLSIAKTPTRGRSPNLTSTVGSWKIAPVSSRQFSPSSNAGRKRVVRRGRGNSCHS